MWLLVREASVPPAARSAQPGRVLAACPDTDDRGEAWRWSVRRVGNDDWQVQVESHPDHVIADHTVLREPGERELVREPGEELVVVAVKGRHLVQDASGPWHRWLEPGDVFVVEGETPERLVLTSEPGEASVVRLRSTGAEPLRWVP